MEWPGWLKCVDTGVSGLDELMVILDGTTMFSKAFV